VPNVWVPAHGTYTLFNRIHLKESDEQILQWKETFRTTDVSLKPVHADDFFKSIFTRHETHRTFRLTVNGPDGKPVPNASCEIRTTTELTAEQVLEGEFVKVGKYGPFTTTNQKGQLCLSLSQRLERLEINISKKGFGPYRASWVSRSSSAGIPDKFTAELDNAWSVGGIVVDEHGAPVADANVGPSIEYKKRPGDTSQLGVGDLVKTDSEGKWRYDHVPASLHHVSVSIHHPDFQPVSKPLFREEFEIQGDSTPSAPIEVPHGFQVRGTIADDPGMPIKDALVRVEIQDEVREARTGENGVYSLNGCDTSVTRIVASASGRARELQIVRVEADMKPVNFILKPGGHIRIRVVDEQGKGLAKTRIFLQRWRGRVDYFEFDHVDDYCDKDGIWEWNEAPLDEFQADINAPGRMGLPKQSLTAREEEYVFTPPQMLLASGRVIDAKTHQPIPKFRVIPGIRNDYNKKLIWINRLGFTATDGTYRVPLGIGEDCPGYVVRIEAENYKPAVSRDFKFDEGEIEYDFELQAASDLAATILTADGAPAAGADVVLSVEGSQVGIQDGRIESANYATRLVADNDGQIRTAAVDGPFELIVTHDSGFAHVASADGALHEPVRLTPWAQGKGTFRIGRIPGKEVTLELYTDGIHSMGSKSPSISASCKAVTAADGRFAFTRVFPGRGMINRSISRDGEYGTVDATSTVSQSVEFTAGKTTTLDYGGKGTAVTGKLMMPANSSAEGFWGFATVYINRVPDLPDTRLGRNRIAYATVNRDGSFRIDDMPAGNYNLSVRFNRDAPGAISEHKFTLPTIAVGETATTVELGELRLIVLDRQ